MSKFFLLFRGHSFIFNTPVGTGNDYISMMTFSRINIRFNIKQIDGINDIGAVHVDAISTIRKIQQGNGKSIFIDHQRVILFTFIDISKSPGMIYFQAVKQIQGTFKTNFFTVITMIICHNEILKASFFCCQGVLIRCGE